MKFLADMGVAWRIMEWLRQQGHDAVHLGELEDHISENVWGVIREFLVICVSLLPFCERQSILCLIYETQNLKEQK